MERGPLPPHERTWRHPSEVAAAERAAMNAEAASSSTRTVALATGTLGLLMVAVLILTVTPRRGESPLAVSAVSTIAGVEDTPPAEPSTSTAPSALMSVAPAPSTPVAPSISVTTISIATTIPGSAPGTTPAATISTTTTPIVTAALATPVGDGRFALVTQAAVPKGGATTVEVQLISGRLSRGEIVQSDSHDIYIVALVDVDPDGAHAIAEHRPSDDEIVTVMASPPVTIAFRDVEELIDSHDVGEGTPVLDDAGALVGLCSDDHRTGDGRVIDVNSEIDAATSAAP